MVGTQAETLYFPSGRDAKLDVYFDAAERNKIPRDDMWAVAHPKAAGLDTSFLAEVVVVEEGGSK